MDVLQVWYVWRENVKIPANVERMQCVASSVKGLSALVPRVMRAIHRLLALLVRH